MDKRSKNILLLFGAFIVLIIIIEILRPQPVNWNSSYTAEDKIPFGCFVIHQELKSLMQLAEMNTINESPFTYLTETTIKKDTTKNQAYVFINNQLYFDTEETIALLDYVEKGNTAFIAASFLGGDITDSLQLTTYTESTLREKETKAHFYSPTFQKTSGTFKTKFYKSYFTKIDTLNTTALGYYSNPDTNNQHPPSAKQELNFIKIPRGKGYIYVHTLPEAFSNYYLLNGNQTYTAHLFSQIDATSILWDNYKKTGRKYIETPLRFILNEKALKWGYYLTLIGLLLFVVFKGKREQRIIPVIKPLENSTIEFTKTIGDLYYQNKNYSNIIHKKITYFLERVRSKYYIDTQKIDQKFAQKLAQKKGKSTASVTQLVELIIKLQATQHHSEEDLINLNKQLELFEKV